MSDRVKRGADKSRSRAGVRGVRGGEAIRGGEATWREPASTGEVSWAPSADTSLEARRVEGLKALEGERRRRARAQPGSDAEVWTREEMVVRMQEVLREEYGTELPRRTVSRVLKVFGEVLGEVLQREGCEARVGGVGRFVSVPIPARDRVHPVTGARYRCQASQTVRFKPYAPVKPRPGGGAGQGDGEGA